MEAATHSFGVTGDQFLLDGKPFQILSGSMHYPRVPRPYWRDRMRKARAMGLNTLCVYVFWNAHEQRPGEFDFSGNLDIKAYIQTAQEEGLWVILRPGPYVCAEWEFGGLPWWLLKDPNMRVRTAYPGFVEAAGKYLHRLGEELAPLQITRGGPIVLCQVENEYGSFGSDHAYMQAIRKMIIDNGFDVTLYTSDGPGLLEKGTLPGLVATINFGAGEDAAAQFSRLAQFRKNGPRMCGEYWDGWFDHWGETHHQVPTKTVTQGLEWMLSRGISVNLYMFHGGTTFGFMPGANQSKQYQPDITSYDYDAPLNEAGRPTP
ncbi:MAG TPA: beta-galactosidase family protein, partial [Tepidisphaeraceae bacterium]|nr:beta-galactosidase family protein [Tepidisphaeraceae bacterium]